jgi:replicative DNA helicase
VSSQLTEERRPGRGSGVLEISGSGSEAIVAERADRPLIDAADAYLGSLLQLPADKVREAAGYIVTADLADPRHQAIYALIRELAHQDIAPDAAAVFAHARTTGQVAGEHRLRGLSKLLSDLYTRAATPASVRFYAAAVVEDALRRRIDQTGQRLRQVADESALGEALAMVGSEARELGEMARRWRTVAFQQQPTSAPSFYDAFLGDGEAA